ncbi:MAG: hypothetical protein JO235_09370 [Chroococcidiopsidaceae cyanobacterium CP_BM_RX_35]|nr:hypothetical protein [Chroococcidiopsidaceae cyanobacterium CP_BM_RX_35]
MAYQYSSSLLLPKQTEHGLFSGSVRFKDFVNAYSSIYVVQEIETVSIVTERHLHLENLPFDVGKTYNSQCETFTAAFEA